MAPEEVVRTFIQRHYDWEVSANRLAESSGDSEESFKTVEAQYLLIISELCSSTVEPQGIAFGSEPGHDPHRETIESMTDQGDAVICHTLHEDADGLTSNYEYHVVEEDGRWVLCHLYYVDERGKFECL